MNYGIGILFNPKMLSQTKHNYITVLLFNLLLYTKQCYYLYRKDQALPWFLIPEIKDFVRDLEKGTIRKNRSTYTDCFLAQVENSTLVSATVKLKSVW